MKASEVRKLSDIEIKEKLSTLRREFLVARCNHATGQLKNTAFLNTVRKSIAQLETLLRERSV